MHSSGVARFHTVALILILSSASISPYSPFNPSFDFLYANEREAHLHVNILPMLAISAGVVEEVRLTFSGVTDLRSLDREKFRASWRENSFLNYLLARLGSHLVYSQSTASDL